MSEEKKSYQPEEPNQKPETINKKDIVLAIIRREDGEVVIMDGSLTNCQGIKEAWHIRALVQDSIDQFVTYLRIEKRKLQSPASMVEAVRNGFGFKKR